MTDDLFPGFASHWIDTEAGRIFARAKGEGEPVVLLHGFPQTQAMWHRIAPALAETHAVVCMDLRGYGWSSAPRGDPSHETYSKRAMGRDVVAAMEALGHVRFAVVGHDRGARVGYRLALDQPGRVERLALLDILPTFANWERISGRLPRPPLGVPRPARSPSRRRRSAATPCPISRVSWRGGRRAARSTPSTRARSPPTGRAGTSRAASTPSARIIGRGDGGCGGGRARPRRRRADRLPDADLWGDAYLSGGGAETALDVWRRSFAPKARGGRVAAGISWRRRTRRGRWGAAGRSSRRADA